MSEYRLKVKETDVERPGVPEKLDRLRRFGAFGHVNVEPVYRYAADNDMSVLDPGESAFLLISFEHENSNNEPNHQNGNGCYNQAAANMLHILSSVNPQGAAPYSENRTILKEMIGYLHSTAHDRSIQYYNIII